VNAPHPLPTADGAPLRKSIGVFRYGWRALRLVWATSPRLTILIGALTLVAGVLPAAIAWVGQLIVDGVVAAAAAYRAHGTAPLGGVLSYVGLEGLVVGALAAVQRGLSASESLLRVQLAQRVNVMILEKALTLQLSHFEDSEFYDKLTRARREASSRPLSLVKGTFGLGQNAVSLLSYGVLLAHFSPWAVALLVAAGLPVFIAEAKFSGDAFRLFHWRAPETRMQTYLETVLAREDSAKEVKLYQLGPKLLERYRDIYARLYDEDRRLTLRRDAWGFGLGLAGTLAFYAAYAWVALAAVRGAISLGQMTMYLLLFKQGQAAVSSILSAVGGMYEDNLYLSNLFEYLEEAVPAESGSALHGPAPADGLRFEHVSFSYPDAEEPALVDVSLHLRPGESLALVGENGAGKTTLIKLLTRLYEPTSGRILLDGLALPDWNGDALRRRIGVIFQDFGRYQFIVGENIGAGDVEHFEDAALWRTAARKGMAEDVVDKLPQGYETQLGRWFKGGRELSGGQWQKIALARAFMRTQADILVLDEPTATMDARAESNIFEHFRTLSAGRMVILISHRFSTVRMADHIVVIERGRIVERGSHAQLLASGGAYAQLFTLQAAGYR
jgi:ATP-binding cassette, subfamily B, bacterial